MEKVAWLAPVMYLMLACNPDSEKRFELLDPDATGIDFINELRPTPELNIFSYLYFYDGGGVAAGDLNGDGLSDLFFISNQGQNRLFLHKGDFTFEDVTDKAFDTAPDDWTTGVTLVDINGSGRLDIYVSVVSGHMNMEGRNRLFVNEGNDDRGIPVFTEQAAEYGLDLVGFSTQAAFFDYDLDGDLDMYMLNHSVHELGTFTHASFREESHPLAGDRLFRNDNGTYREVTGEAGIYNSALGYGLGIGISDLNQSGYPDIYIGNDFHEDDYLYINNGDGTFTESLGKMIRHTSYSSMGNDLIDINNNGLTDIFSLDMLPEDYERSKASAAEDPLEIHELKRSYGYKEKVSRNTLQLNRGNGVFSEIGMLAGVHATDWSWSALGADFNHNGNADLFVSNGIKHRTDNLDYLRFITRDSVQQRLGGDLTEEDLALAGRAPPVNIPNYLYENLGDLSFRDVTAEWGLDQPSFSSGAV
ncbi:MAG: VCBS repeat-containing protein, partial [Balneolales bacterium]